MNNVRSYLPHLKLPQNLRNRQHTGVQGLAEAIWKQQDDEESQDLRVRVRVSLFPTFQLVPEMRRELTCLDI